ncbi:unnamed protein product [Ascophyllum nodosum]
MHPNGFSCVLAGSTYGNWNTTNAGLNDFMVVNLDIDGYILWEWQDGTVGDDHIYAGGVAKDGSVILAGGTTGGYAAESAGSFDFLVIKLDGDGEVLWTWQGGTNSSDVWYGLSVSEDGSVVLAGQTDGSWNATSAGVSDWAAMKLDAEGTVVWKWQDGGAGKDYLRGAALSDDGSVVLGGVLNGSDFAAVKLDADGTENWVWQDGTDELDQFWAIAAAGNGSVVLAGFTYGNWSGTSAGFSDFAAVKLDSTGTEVWRWQEGSGSFDRIRGAAALNEGSVILVGETDQNFVATNQGYGDFATFELDANGTVLWRWQNDMEEDDDFKAVAADQNGRFLMAGGTDGGWNGFNSGAKDFAAILFDANASLSFTSNSSLPTPRLRAASTSNSSLSSMSSSSVMSTSTSSPPSTPSPTSSFSTTTIVGVVVAGVVATVALLAVCLWWRIRRRKKEDSPLTRGMDASQMATPSSPPKNALELEKSAALAGHKNLTKVEEVDAQEDVAVEGGNVLTALTMATPTTSAAIRAGPLPCNPSVDATPETMISESGAEKVAVPRKSIGSAFPGRVEISPAMAVMEAASTVASSSSIPGVSEAARLVSVLVQLVVDKEDVDTAGEKRVRWCRSIVALLERASELIEKRGEIGQKEERYLLEDVRDSVSDLVAIMQTYNAKGKISRLFMSTLFRRRQDEAEAVINHAISRLQFGLQVQAGHDLVSVGRDVRDMKAERKTRENPPQGSITDSTNNDMAKSRSARRQRRLQQLEIPEDQLILTDVLLGKGGFGEVYLADYSGVNAAAKVIQIDNDQALESDLYEFDSTADGEDRVRQLELEANQRKMFFRELQAMTRLKSPHTVQVFGAITSRKDRLVLVMELMPGGDLRTLLRHAGERLPEVRERQIMNYICSGMAFLHNKGVIHGDLKSANVLFDSAGMAKIADFGTARWTQHVASTCLATAFSATKSNNAHMSIAWAAPEVLDDERASFKSDVYSFGVVAWEIVTRQTPWGNLNARTIIRRVLTGERPEIPRETAAELAEVIGLCWREDPKARPKFTEILDRIKL